MEANGNYKNNKMIATIEPTSENSVSGFFHCTNRSVRRTVLCNKNDVNNNHYFHYKDWIEKKILELSNSFSVSLYAYAVMDSHYHIVLQLNSQSAIDWTEEQVAENWLRAFPGQLDDPNYAKQRILKKLAILTNKDKLQLYRQRLGSVSWFLKCINESVENRNREENQVNWDLPGQESSYSPLLDTVSIISCMTYVDLNPVREKITEKIHTSSHTSIKKRISSIKQKYPIAVQAYLDGSVQALTNKKYATPLSISLQNYIELVDWTGSLINKVNTIPTQDNINEFLCTHNLLEKKWFNRTMGFSNHYCELVGIIEQLISKLRQLKIKCQKGISAAKLLYNKTS